MWWTSHNRLASVRRAVTVRGIFVGDYKGSLLFRLDLDYCVALVVAVVELGQNSPSRLIVFEHEQTSDLAQRACTCQR